MKLWCTLERIVWICDPAIQRQWLEDNCCRFWTDIEYASLHWSYWWKACCDEKCAFSGFPWHKYKGFFSMVLLAICDARYNFTAIDVGQYGSNNDSGILLNSKMENNFEKDSFYVPAPEKTHDFTIRKCRFFLLVTKSSRWSIGWCDHMPVNNWQLKQDATICR